MKKYSVLLISFVISVLFILLTAWISFSRTGSIAFEFSFIFHLIPFGIGFSGGASILIFVYYFLLWIGLSLLISPIIKAFYSSKNRKKILLLSITPIILLTFIVVYIDYSKNKEREKRIAINQKKNKEDFYHLRTGDLLFQKINKDSALIDSLKFDSTYNNIGIVFIDGQNYALLEANEKVKYVSIRQWVQNGNSDYYVAKRLRNADSLLSNSGIQKLRNEVSNNIMKDCDNFSEWSDDRMYNAKLIWKIYKRSLNVELGSPEIIKVDTVSGLGIKSSAIFNSENLVTVKME